MIGDPRRPRRSRHPPDIADRLRSRRDHRRAPADRRQPPVVRGEPALRFGLWASSSSAPSSSRRARRRRAGCSGGWSSSSACSEARTRARAAVDVEDWWLPLTLIGDRRAGGAARARIDCAAAGQAGAGRHAAGPGTAIGGRPRARMRRPAPSSAATRSLSEIAIWAGKQRRSVSPMFRHADLTAIMGGIELDLRGASTVDGRSRHRLLRHVGRDRDLGPAGLGRVESRSACSWPARRTRARARRPRGIG